MSSRRGVAFPDPWLHAEESELRKRNERAQDYHGGLALMDNKLGLMNGIRCVCGSNASAESIATLSVESPEAESRAIVASLHQVLFRTTARGQLRKIQHV